jgi:hypothetical protein
MLIEAGGNHLFQIHEHAMITIFVLTNRLTQYWLSPVHHAKLKSRKGASLIHSGLMNDDFVI